MKEFVPLRNSKELQQDLTKAREILSINKDIHGADPKTIREALKFTAETHELIWEDFLQRYGVLAREYIKSRLLGK